MFQSQELKDQSISLLKEQTTKLKIQSRDLELKDEQIRFLKETILTLEQEKDSVAHHNHQLKTKLKAMAGEISDYNANVVQKIYQENQELIDNIQTLKNDLEAAVSQRSETNKKYMHIQAELEHQLRQKQELLEVNEMLKEAKSKNEKKINILEKENKEIQQKNIALQRQVDQSSHQINYCSQQIDILTQKHQDSLKHNQKKIKQTVDKMVGKEEYERIQKELKDSFTRNTKILKEIQRKEKEKEKIKLELLTCKEKIITFQINQETKSLQLKTDIINLTQSIKIGKKIAEFESEEHENVCSIYDLHSELVQKNEKLRRKLQITEDKVNSLETDKKVAEQTLRLMEIELNTIRERREEEKESLEVEYESKLMEISIRLRKEEMSLAIIKNKESSLEQLQEQFEHAQEEHKLERQTLQRTIQQLSKQNKKLSEELSSAVRLCEQNMLDRQCIMNYKYVLQDIIAVVHYLFVHLGKRKQKISKIYRPFISRYFDTKAAIKKDGKDKGRLIKIFKRCAWVIIAINRMKREMGSGKGLARYAKNAIERRYNIKDLSSHVEKISTCIIKGGKVQQILRQSDRVYKWKLPSYKRVSFNEEGSSKGEDEPSYYEEEDSNR